MIEARKDFDLLWKMTESYRKKCSMEILTEFMKNPNHVMLVDGNNVGLATQEYPGLYNVHWFFEVRGREAIRLGREMLNYLFDNYDAKAVRGVVTDDNKKSRWAGRQVGMKSYGKEEYADGEVNELFCITKDEFQSRVK